MSSLPRNFFDFFELDRKLVLDNAALQEKFYALSRKWHPDRFSRKSVQEQAEALDATSILNDGYRTLKDPVTRAEYLLEQEGYPIGEQRSKDVPPELLEEVFDLNMMLEELKGGDDSAKSSLAAARENFSSMLSNSDAQLEGLFTRYDAAEEESESARQALAEVRAVLNRRRYIQNLIRDVDRALRPEGQAPPLEDVL